MRIVFFSLLLISGVICHAGEDPEYRDACSSSNRILEGTGFAVSSKTSSGEKISDFWQATGRNMIYDSSDKAIKSLCALKKDAALIQGHYFNQKGIEAACVANCNDRLLDAQKITESVRNYLLNSCTSNCRDVSIRYDAYSKGLKAGKDSCYVGGKNIKPGRNAEPDQPMGAR